MTLAALEKYSPQERAGILADLALATSPQPEAGGRVDEGLQAILTELSQKAGVSDAPFTQKAKVLLDVQIAKALSVELLRDRDVNEALGRAGNAGRLPNSLYEINIGEPFRRRFSPLRVSDADVQSCVRHADDVEHLDLGDNDTVSLFARFIENKDGRDPFWAIAHMHRVGRVLHAHCYWRAYPSELNLSQAHAPSHVLQALAGVCGTGLTINGQRDVFFRDREVPNIDNSLTMKPDEHSIFSVSERHDHGGFRILIAYAISIRKYREYLIRHELSLREIASEETLATAAYVLRV